MFTKITNYCKESYDELVHKVSWPTRSELSSSAVVVLTASLLIALVVFSNGFCLPVYHGRCYLSALINSKKNMSEIEKNVRITCREWKRKQGKRIS